MLAQTTNSDEHLNINGSANERSSHHMSSRPLLDQIRIILKDGKLV